MRFIEDADIQYDNTHFGQIVFCKQTELLGSTFSLSHNGQGIAWLKIVPLGGACTLTAQRLSETVSTGTWHRSESSSPQPLPQPHSSFISHLCCLPSSRSVLL